MNRENRNTILFIGFFLLAGILYALTRSRSPLLNTVLFAITYMIYEGLLIFWIQSVHGRLLPSRSRTYAITAAGLIPQKSSEERPQDSALRSMGAQGYSSLASRPSGSSS